jgi:diketogulonate reductase-like aldo/keto reductase
LGTAGNSAVVTLNNGGKNSKAFPLASFGLQVYDDDTAYRLTLTALEVGYRNFFASVLAGNQIGFARAIKASGIPRDELYICGTVLSNRVNGEQAAYAKTKQGCLENMAAFSAGNISKLDMIMLDYPGPNDESIRGQWRAFEDMAMIDKTVSELAVSNFSPIQLDAILINPNSIKPTVNQLPFSVAYHPKGVLEYNTQRGILVQSWSPLSRVLPRYGDTLDTIGKKYGKSAAQVGLRWIIQNGAAFSTQSKKKSHFEEDLNVFDFILTNDEMEKITQLAA